MNANTGRIYMDYASATPLDPRALSAMMPFLEKDFSNPSSAYEEGLRAKKAIAEARKKIADALGARPEELIFTGSGTEANNLALLGAFRAAKEKRRVAETAETETAAGKRKPHVVTTAIEHPSVLEVVKQIEREGGEATLVPVGEDGIVDPKKIADALRPETVLVSVMHANNEIGTIQPLAEIARVIRKHRGGGPSAVGFPYFHTDASQSANYLSLDALRLGVDLLTLDASKIYGPKGVGMLYVRKGVRLSPIMFGGGQEKGMRPGTENVPGIVGLAEALALAQGSRESESARLAPLRDRLIAGILAAVPGASLNGDAEERLPNNASICFPPSAALAAAQAEFYVVKLDSLGIACAAASACTTLSGDSSSKVVAATRGAKCASSSIRFSLGRRTREEDIERVIQAVRSML